MRYVTRAAAQRRLVAHYRPIIRRALAAQAPDGHQIVARFMRAAKSVRAVAPTYQTATAAERNLLLLRAAGRSGAAFHGVLGEFTAEQFAGADPDAMARLAEEWAGAQHVDTAPLASAIDLVNRDAWPAGSEAAYRRLPRALRANGVRPGAAVDWAKWRPGHAEVAARLDPKKGYGGLQWLLDESGTVIEDIGRTTLGRIGSALAAGLRAGESITEMAQRLDVLLDDPERALAIAQTEVSRAMVAGARDTYRANGITQFQVLNPDPCPECETAVADGPWSVDDDGPPFHPGCLCEIEAVVESAADETMPFAAVSYPLGRRPRISFALGASDGTNQRAGVVAPSAEPAPLVSEFEALRDRITQLEHAPAVLPPIRVEVVLPPEVKKATVRNVERDALGNITRITEES